MTRTRHGRAHAADLASRLERRRVAWPSCDTCGAPAEIVCASPAWEAEGFRGQPADAWAWFCCRRHTERTGSWYWFWIVAPDERDDTSPTLWDPGFLIHLGQKTWGPPFVAWLLSVFDFYAWNQPEQRNE